MDTQLHELLIQLVRLGIGATAEAAMPAEGTDWPRLKALADKQGLGAVVLDGLEVVRRNDEAGGRELPDRALLAQWIGDVMKGESQYGLQREMARKVARLFHKNGIRTYVLKGTVVSECYPRPEHRVSVDVDCYLKAETDRPDAWEAGNELIRQKGVAVNKDFYKNSAFWVGGVMFENHQYFTPFRGNKRLTALETTLQTMMSDDRGEDVMEGTWLYRPPVMATALFLIEHAYSHFLHEGLTWRHVLDWMMFSRKHQAAIDWQALDAMIDEFGFRRFYDSYQRLGQYLTGELSAEHLEESDGLMLQDVWADLDLHESVRGLQGKLALVGNTWRARWKYRHFTDISMLHALWIQVKGFLFDKNPKLGRDDHKLRELNE